MFAATSAGAVTVVNGSFEDVQISAQGSKTLSDIPGWTHSGSTGDGLIWSDKFGVCCGGTGTTKTGDGHQFVTLGGGFGPTGTSAWSQLLSGLIVGDMYAVDFMMAAEGELSTQPITVAMTSGSTTAPGTFISDPAVSLFWQVWAPRSYHFLATSTSGELQFSVTDQPYDTGLDAVSVHDLGRGGVPEPTAWTLMILGFGLAGAALRRRVARPA
jgi:hypothetical protein